MKQVIRTSILMLVVVGSYLVAAAPQVPAMDGGPILTCPPNAPKCVGGNLPPRQ
jgi:hypothetical protein